MNLIIPFEKLKKKLVRSNEDEYYFSGFDEIEEDVPMSTTDKASYIISNAMSNGRYGQMNEQMRELSDSIDERETFIFAPKRFLLDYLYAILFIATSLGLGFFSLYGYLLLSYTDYYNHYAIGIMSITVFCFLCNIVLVIRIFKNHSFTKRFPRYIDCLSRKNIEFIDDVADYTGIATKQVTRDIKKAVSCGLIPQGHLAYAEKVLFTSDTSFKIYLANQAKLNVYFKKQLQKRDFRNHRDPKINKVIQKGEMHVHNIRSLNDIIKDKGITKKLDHMEEVVSSIFYEVDNNPSYAKELGLLLEKYLPMVDKLLDQYINLSTAIVPGTSLKKSQHQIEGTLDTLNEVFEKTLKQFYQEQERSLMESILSINDIVKAEEELKGVSIDELMEKYT